jgi:hypothetical protein
VAIAINILSWAGSVTGIFGWEDLLGTVIGNFIYIASIVGLKSCL